MKTEITIEGLRAALTYCPETGEFSWRGRPSRNVPFGASTGAVNGRGYRVIVWRGKTRQAHRLAWAHHYGRWPTPGKYIDHINGDKTDNRIANLREVTSSESAINRRVGKKQSGLPRGVSRHISGRFQAVITKDRRQRYIGLFATPEDAHGAYVAAAADVHGEFARSA